MTSPLVPIVALLAASALGAENVPPKAEGFTPVRTVGGISEYRLDSNGLRVLLVPQKLAPVVTFMVTYHVGSRNEVTGTTGATHLLEHLMFKGTPTHDRSQGHRLRPDPGDARRGIRTRPPGSTARTTSPPCRRMPCRS